MKSPRRKLWRSPSFWAVLVALAAAAGFVMFSDTGRDWIEAVNGWAQDLMADHPVLGAGVFFLLSVGSAILAFASSVVIVPAASEAWGKPATLALLWSGWMTGALLTYAIGHYARPLLHRLVDREDLERYQKITSKRMKLWAATLVCLAVPSELPGYLFGALRYPLVKFLIAIGVAEAVYATGVVLAGDSLVEAKPTVLVATGLGMVTVAVAASYVLRRQRKRAA